MILRVELLLLNKHTESGMLAVGDVGELSPNASAMLRISTLTAWAELQVASSRQSYLKAIIDPYGATLAMLWIASLRDYASIRGDSEVLQDSTSAAMDISYSGMGREVLLPVRTFLLSGTANLAHLGLSTTKPLGGRS